MGGDSPCRGSGSFGNTCGVSFGWLGGFGLGCFVGFGSSLISLAFGEKCRKSSGRAGSTSKRRAILACRQPIAAHAKTARKGCDRIALWALKLDAAQPRHLSTSCPAALFKWKIELLVQRLQAREMIQPAESDEKTAEAGFVFRRFAPAHFGVERHDDLVGVQHGFGHTALGRLAAGRGTSDAILRPTASDPLSGQALHKEACVRIMKA